MTSNAAGLPLKLLSFFLAFHLCAAAAAADAWKIGKVAAASVASYSAEAKAKSGAAARQDIWWNYDISAGGTCYSAAASDNPARTGLATGSRVRFREKKNRMIILQPSGKLLELRIVRKGRADSCP